MKQLIIMISALFIIAAAGGVMAQDMSHDHTTHGTSMEEAVHGEHRPAAREHGAMDHPGHSGENIHNAVVDGYRFAYHLIDIREKMTAMKAAGHAHEGMDATHHLMTYIESPNGTKVETAQVGYFVEGPDGITQKLMCMEMGGGFGSDLNLGHSGDYLINTKVVAGGVTLVDGFSYPGK